MEALHSSYTLKRAAPPRLQTLERHHSGRRKHYSASQLSPCCTIVSVANKMIPILWFTWLASLGLPHLKATLCRASNATDGQLAYQEEFLDFALRVPWCQWQHARSPRGRRNTLQTLLHLLRPSMKANTRGMSWPGPRQSSMVSIFESLLGKARTHTLEFEIFKSFVRSIALFALKSALGLLCILRTELRAYTELVLGSWK